jgi:hypothetical protein
MRTGFTHFSLFCKILLLLKQLLPIFIPYMYRQHLSFYSHSPIFEPHPKLIMGISFLIYV